MGSTKRVAEASTARMNFRTKPRIKAAIQRAALLSGMDESAFALDAAYRRALDTISTHERTELGAADHAAFLAALDAPPEPTDALREAFARLRDVDRG